jgi:hypothetical protein
MGNDYREGRKYLEADRVNENETLRSSLSSNGETEGSLDVGNLNDDSGLIDFEQLAVGRRLHILLQQTYTYSCLPGCPVPESGDEFFFLLISPPSPT